MVRDSGILHQLLGIKTAKHLLENPKCGASWEGYIIEEIIQLCQPDSVNFWATHNCAEIDLLLIKDDQIIGVGCKRANVPRITPSIKSALNRPDVIEDRNCLCRRVNPCHFPIKFMLSLLKILFRFSVWYLKFELSKKIAISIQAGTEGLVGKL